MHENAMNIFIINLMLMLIVLLFFLLSFISLKLEFENFHELNNVYCAFKFHMYEENERKIRRNSIEIYCFVRTLMPI